MTLIVLQLYRQPLLGWRAQWERWHCEKCARRNCRRFQHCPGVLLSSTFFCDRPGHRVRIFDFSPLFLLMVGISSVTGLLLVASYRDHKIAGQNTSHNPSGLNIHISSHVWLWLPSPSFSVSLPRYSSKRLAHFCYKDV